MTYQVWVAVGIIAAFAVRAVQPRDALGERRAPIVLAAVVGAVLGAYLLEMPADLMGWTTGIDGRPVGDGGLLGGRTVLGGLIGGWLTVELAKRILGVRQATGDGFAAPLAVALACGRMGCAAAGCCAGVVCPPDAWWRAGAVADHAVLRLPAQHIEVVFHIAAAGLLVFAARRGWWPGRRLAAYLTAYALLRFALEFGRGNPPMLAGMTWFQVLALVLAAIAGVTWWRRAQLSRVDRPPTG